MLLASVAILVGFLVLIWSADLFVAGAASIARKLGLSPIIIGLTIVSLGTSAPEVLVSLTAALAGAGELAIGNAIGSNIANITLVFGITLLVAPLMVEDGCMTKEVPVLLVITFGVWALIANGVLSRVDGLIMLAALSLLMAQLLRTNRLEERVGMIEQGAQADTIPQLSIGRAWLSFFLGLALLIASSKLLVWGAVQAAQALGVSELVIGLTIVAIGTSLPELAATIASALRGHTEIALGNIVGSNIFNLLVVMSIPGIVEPQVLDPLVGTRDYPVMAGLTVVLALAIFLSARREKASPGHAYLGRLVGTLLVSCYGLYYYLLHITI